MSRRSAYFGRALAGLAAMGACSAYGAELYPTTLVMPRDKPVATLHIKNSDSKAVVFEISGFDWRQNDSGDVLTPAEDLVITPPIISLAPGEAAIVRVGLLSADSGDANERAYRLLVDDVSGPKNNPSAGLNVRIQFVLPVFLAPADPAQSVELTAAPDADGRLCINGRNAGASHVKVVSLAAGEAPEKVSPQHQYILAGAQVHFCPETPVAGVHSGSLIAGIASAYQSSVTPYVVTTTERPVVPSRRD